MKKITLSLFAASTCLLVISCKNGPQKETVKDTSTTGPVENRTSKTGYKPAFEGQKRVNRVKTTTAYQVERIAEKIGNP